MRVRRCAHTSSHKSQGKTLQRHLNDCNVTALAQVRTTIANWTFNVDKPPAFALRSSAKWSATKNGALAAKYERSFASLLCNEGIIDCVCVCAATQGWRSGDQAHKVKKRI